MRRLVNNICLIVCTLMLPLLCCGCFKDEDYVNKNDERKAHNGDLKYYMSFEIDGEQYEMTELYYFDGITVTTVHMPPAKPYKLIDELLERDNPIFGSTYYQFSSRGYSFFGTQIKGVGFYMRVQSRMNSETKWVPNRRYFFNSDISVSCKYYEGSILPSQPPYGWISFRPLNDEYAFEALFEFDIDTEKGEIIEFRNGKLVSYYRGRDAVRNDKVFAQ